MKVEIIKQKEYNFLWVNGELMMWDIPVERRAQKKLADQASGDVLVAGYGLGVVQEYLSANPKVNSIVTIEKFKEVVDEAEKAYGKLYGEIEIQDFFEFETNKKFDYVIGDIWKDIEEEALDDYKKFKNKAQTLLKPNGKILAWGQEFFEYLENK